MRLILLARAGVGLLFVLCLVTSGAIPRTKVAAGKVAAGTEIVIHFHGLIVFDKEVSGDGKQVVRLRSGAKNHRVQIQIKGPGFGDFLDWGHRYEKDADLKLEVVKGTPTSAYWGTKMRPFGIATLHSGLSRRDNKLRPTFTINAGKFDCLDEIPVSFENDDSDPQPEVKAARHVIARIFLSPGQEARLTGKELPTIELGGDKWEIKVGNSPTLEHICDEYHFIHYYEGFGMSNGSDVPKRKRYKAKSPGIDDCVKGKITGAAIPSRPCIPISYP